MKKQTILLAFAACISLIGATSAQHQEIPFKSDFENGTGNWQFANDSLNTWQRGRAASCNSTYGLYISRNQGASNKYETGTTQVSYAWIEFQLPETDMILEFDYRVGGETSGWEDKDFLSVYLSSLDLVPTAGKTLEAEPLEDPYVTQYGEIAWKHSSIQIPREDFPTGQNAKIVFAWQNNGQDGTQPAGAIDNVILRLDNCPTPQHLSFQNIPDSLTAHSASICWDRIPDARYTISLSEGWDEPFAEYKTKDTVFTLTGLKAETRYSVAVKAVISEFSYSGFSEDFIFLTPEACPEPQDFRCKEQDNRILFEWEPGSGKYLFAYHLTENNAWTEHALNENSYTLDLNQLEPASSYTARLRQICENDTSLYTQTLQFNSPCPEINSLPYSCHFENWTDENIPVCWQIVDGNNDHSTWHARPGSGTDNSIAAYCEANRYNASNDWLITPAIRIEGSPTLQLAYSSASSLSMDTEKLSVFISSQGSDTTILRQNLLFSDEDITKNDGWQNAKIPLADFAGETIHIGILAHSDAYQGGILIDDLAIITCSPVNHAEIISTGNQSASIAFESEARQTLIRYYPEAQPALAQWLVSASPAELKNLQAATEYVAELYNICNDGDTSQAASLTFKTACNAFSLPFTENFEGLSNRQIPDCWDNSQGDLENDNYKWGCGTAYDSEGNCMDFNAAFATKNSHNILQTPDIALNGSTQIQLSFRYKNTDGYKSQTAYSQPSILRIYISKDQGISFDTLCQNLYGGQYWADTLFDISALAAGAETIRVYFDAVSNYGSSHIYLDDIRVEIPPTCFPPLSAQASEIGKNEATISWENDSRSDEAAYSLLYYPADKAGDTIRIDNAVPPETLTGLIAQTRYAVFIRAHCSLQDSSQSFIFYFSTLEACSGISHVQASEITGNSARISWQHEGAETYRIKWSQDGALWDSTETSETEIQLENLAGSATYSVMVKALCSANEESEWSEIAEFQTECGNMSLPFHESFEGDGLPSCWNFEMTAGNEPFYHDAWDQDYEMAYLYEAHSGEFCLRFTSMGDYDSYNMNGGEQARLLLPPFNAKGTKIFSFWFFHTSYDVYGSSPVDDADVLFVGYIDSDDLLHPLDTLRRASDEYEGEWVQYSYAIPAEQGRIYLEGCAEEGGYTYGNLYIDDVELRLDVSYDLALSLSGYNPFHGARKLPVDLQLTNTGSQDFNKDIAIAIFLDQDSLFSQNIALSENPIASGESRRLRLADSVLVSEAGIHALEARILSEDDQTPGNDRAQTGIEFYHAFPTPYTTQFASNDPSLAYMQVIDANHDSISWEKAYGNGFDYAFNPDSAADDYLILPAFHLNPGEYTLKLGLEKADANFPESAAVYLFPERFQAGSGQSLMELPYIQSKTIQDSGRFLIEAEGSYYLAIHACSERDQMGLSAKAFSLKNTLVNSFIQANICQGDSYAFGGKELTESGTYFDTLSSLAGIDSLVRLDLSVHPSYSFSLDTAICQGSIIVFGGKTYAEAGEFEENHPSVWGCDSIYHLRLEVLQRPEPPVISQTGENDSIVLVSNQNENNQWYKDDARIPDAVLSRYTVTESGIYHATVTDRCGESDASNRLDIKIDENGNEHLAREMELQVYPNPTRDKVNVHIGRSVIEEIRLFNAAGILVLVQEGQDSRQAEIDLSKHPSGLYLLQIECPEGSMIYKMQISR